MNPVKSIRTIYEGTQRRQNLECLGTCNISRRYGVVHTETILRMELLLQRMLGTESDERFIGLEGAIGLV